MFGFQYPLQLPMLIVAICYHYYMFFLILYMQLNIFSLISALYNIITKQKQKKLR